MIQIVFCGLDVEQIYSYLNGNKDTELRKTRPNTEIRIGKKLADISIVIKTMGSEFGYIIGYIDEAIEVVNAKELWKLNTKYKFGISKGRFDDYFKNYKNKVHLFHFKKIELIYPPIKDFPSYQTWGYINFPSSTKTYPLSNKEIRDKLVKLTDEIKKKLEE